MGRIVQKRLVRKLDLEKLLLQIKPHPMPKPDLEQYTVSAETAATMLYIAAYTNNDIIGKKILDLGCGTGRLALGAAYLGAKQVVGVDIDKTAVRSAYENSVQADLKTKTQWINADINVVRGRFDTVLQNPPFGIQTIHADLKFLKKAVETGKRIYSFHKGSCNAATFRKTLNSKSISPIPTAPTLFLKKFIEKNGGEIRGVYAMNMSIPHMFNFHMKRKHTFAIDLYVIETKTDQDSLTRHQKVY